MVLILKIHLFLSTPLLVEEEWAIILAKVLMVVVRVLDGVPLKHQVSLMLIVAFEYLQVIPTGLHNLSKIFRPNLATTRVFFLGMKFIPT